MTSERAAFFRLAAWLSWLAALLNIAAAWAALLNTVIPGKVGNVLRAQIIAHEPWRWSPAFILAAIAAFLLLPIMLAAADLIESRPLASRIGRAYGAAGAVIAAVTQFLQAAIPRKAALGMIAEHLERGKQPYLVLSTEWNLLFPFSTAYGLAMLGATFIAVLLACLGGALIRERGLRRILGSVALLAAAAQFVGAVGYLADHVQLNFGADVCDLLMPVVLILLGFVFRNEGKSGTAAGMTRSDPRLDTASPLP